MERLRRDEHRIDAENVAGAIHAAVGIKARMVEEDVFVWNTVLQKVDAGGIHFVVAHRTVVSGDEYLRHLPRRIERDSSVGARPEDRRERAVRPDRRAQDERRLRGGRIGDIVDIRFRADVDEKINGGNAEDDRAATEFRVPESSVHVRPVYRSFRLPHEVCLYDRLTAIPDELTARGDDVAREYVRKSFLLAVGRIEFRARIGRYAPGEIVRAPHDTHPYLRPFHRNHARTLKEREAAVRDVYLLHRPVRCNGRRRGLWGFPGKIHGARRIFLGGNGSKRHRLRMHLVQPQSGKYNRSNGNHARDEQIL